MNRTVLSWLLPLAVLVGLASHDLPAHRDTVELLLVMAVIAAGTPAAYVAVMQALRTHKESRQRAVRRAFDRMLQADEKARRDAHLLLQREPSGLPHRLQAMQGGGLGHWDLDVDRHCLTVHSPFQQAPLLLQGTGQQPASLWLQVLHPDESAALTRTLTAVIQGDLTRMEFEHRLPLPQGGWGWVLSRSTLIDWDESGRVRRVVGAFLDVTDQRRLRLNLEREKALFDAGDVLLFKYALTGDRQILAMSGNAARILRQKSPSWSGVGLTTDAMAHPEDLPRLREQVRATIERQEHEFQMSVRMKTGDGMWRWFSLHGVIARQDDRPVLHGYMLDIHEQLQMLTVQEQENLHLEWLVERLEKARGTALTLQRVTDLLNSARNETEAAVIVQQAAEALLPGWHGALSIGRDGRLYVLGRWGCPPAMLEPFHLRDCWSLRRNKSHTYQCGGCDALCLHLTVDEDPIPASICVPLSTTGDAIGAIHLFAPHEMLPQELREAEELAGRLAEGVKSALASLRLRDEMAEPSA
ncbi:PAS domain S-box protein [Aquabacterium lacunae]|uniref:histidine kinase n=1 Tax=Aquabacterium lacunae TaxID=2528630 RepID=A0A4V2JFM2_9BURK|nr:PAS domain-containing protein [Aquabacterium lacunae]TBO29318.1 PAS domain S-box protein [Aquabacterium lacunae]